MTHDPHAIQTLAQLQALFGQPGEASLKKEIDWLHPSYRALIEASPFAVLATLGPDGLDASPRGDPPGFVAVKDEKTLWMPERRGNNRIDSLRNIVADPRVALLFLIPGVGETLRVNGRARLTVDPALLARFAVEGKPPQCVIEIAVETVFFQCARAIQRSRLWAPRTPRRGAARRAHARRDPVGADRCRLRRRELRPRAAGAAEGHAVLKERKNFLRRIEGLALFVRLQEVGPVSDPRRQRRKPRPPCTPVSPRSNPCSPRARCRAAAPSPSCCAGAATAAATRRWSDRWAGGPAARRSAGRPGESSRPSGPRTRPGAPGRVRGPDGGLLNALQARPGAAACSVRASWPMISTSTKATAASSARKITA